MECAILPLRRFVNIRINNMIGFRYNDYQLHHLHLNNWIEQPKKETRSPFLDFVKRSQENG